MDIFDLENDLPDEIMASTSQPTSATRNNFRVIPTSDGSNRLRIQVVEPMPSTSESTQSDQSQPSTSSLRTATTSSSFLPQSALNLSMPQTISTQTGATSSLNCLPHLQNIQSFYTPPTQSQAAAIPWYLHHRIRAPNNQSVYPTASSQPVDMSSSSFLPQSQTNQYIHPANSSLSASVSSSSFLHQPLSNQSVYPSTSSQSMDMSSNSLLNQPLGNQSAYPFSSRVTTKQSIYPTAPSQPLSLNSLTTSRSINQSPFTFSPYVPSYVPSSPRYIPPTSSTQNHPQFSPVTIASSYQPRTMERKIADMKKRWLGDHGRQTQGDSQASSSITQAQPTASSALPQSIPQNVQAIVTGLKNLENAVTKTVAVSETPFGQQSQNRENQIAMNLAQHTPSVADNASSSNKNLTINTHQNITKEWQKQINIELREHLVGNIVQTMFPTNVLPASVVQSLKSYIEKMEREVYETANSKNEYYLLLAEKSYKIQKEINKKRQERKEQQLQQQQQQQQQAQQAQNSQQDIEMSVIQSPDEVAGPLDSNSNIAKNQSSNPTSGASHILSLVNNVSNDKQKNFTKEWHKQIGAELREILVKEFVQKMLPVTGSEAVINNSGESSSTINDRIKSYAKNVECDIYQKADSRIEYYDLLADKYCKMKEELGKGNFAALDNSQ